MDINTAIVEGNLCADPELKEISPESKVAKLRVAHNTRSKKGDDWVDKPNYFTISAWNRQADYAVKHLSKGTRVVIQGRLEHRQWQAEDGSKREAVTINADLIRNFRLPEAKVAKEESGPDGDLPF